MLRAGWLGVLIAVLTLAQEPQVFRSGTRLVEIEVVVRDKNGPVKGLTRDDFTVLDQGKPQAIAIFRSPASRIAAASSSAPLAPGSFSNRLDSRGQPLDGATVVLLDQLNTKIDYKAHERKQMVQFLRALSETDRIALYSLGKDLHILQDFTSDPQKLIDGIAKLDPGLDQLPDYVGDGAGAGGTLADSVAEDCKDFGPGAGMCRRNAASTAALQAGVNQGIYNDITTGALERIIEHLSGVPGRKNLVWLKEHPEMPPGILAMLEQANIALYPVMTHSVEFGGLGLNEPMTPKMTHVTPGPEFFSLQHAVSDLAASTGGAGFDDAADLTTAVRTAEEDAQNSYTLGYYPPEEALDGKFHRIIVKVSSKTTEARYRPGYLATKSALPAPAPSLADLMESPLDATAIGLSAQATPDPERFGFYRLRITVDLRDIHLERKDGRLAGGFDVSFLFPNSQSAKIKTYPVEIAIAEDRLAETIKQGYSLRASGLDGTPGEIFVAVRDRATGAAGSLRIPFARQ